MRKALTPLAGVFVVAAGSVLALAGPASANETPASCDSTAKTVTTHLINRPDSGHHGEWALNTMNRTVKIKKVEAAQMSVASQGWAYQADVTDDGTFVTNGGAHLSPNKGHNLIAGTKGTITGSFTVSFTAPACFGGYQGNYSGQTYSGTAPASSGEWVAKVWGGHKYQVTTDLDANYVWTYKTCNETWLEAHNNNDGQAAGAGDITGEGTCPTTAPTTAPTVAPIVLPGTSRSAVPAASLPVTGSDVGMYAGIGVVLLAGGLGAVFFNRRRRFTA